VDQVNTGFPNPTQVLVGALLGTGSGGITYGIARYFSNLRLLDRGKFKPAVWSTAGLGMAVAGFPGIAYVGTIREELLVRKKRSDVREP